MKPSVLLLHRPDVASAERDEAAAGGAAAASAQRSAYHADRLVRALGGGWTRAELEHSAL